MNTGPTQSGLGAQQQAVLDQLLMEAVGNKDLAHVQLYAEKGANVNMSAGTLYENISRNGSSQGINREAPLFHFLYFKGLRAEIADYLIAQGVDVDARDAQGNTALMLAAKQGDVAGVKYFVSRGADPMASNGRGEIVLEEARGLQVYYHSNRQQIVDALVNAMPDVPGRPQAGQAAPAQDVELPRSVPPTALQKRLNSRFNP